MTGDPLQPSTYRLDHLRRHAVALATAAGLAPSRATALANHLLWYDSAGFPAHGLATLPRWLDRLAAAEVDPAAEGKVLRPEHAGTAIIDAGRGIAPLILSRAAGIAVEKARDTGLGLVRVSGLGPSGPVAEIAAEVAIGPYLAILLGPGPTLALALPSDSGLPLVHDPALFGLPASADLDPLHQLLVGDGEWLVQAVTIPAIESLGSFHERLAGALRRLRNPGWLDPLVWEEARRVAREKGLELLPQPVAELARHAARLGVPPLS